MNRPRYLTADQARIEREMTERFSRHMGFGLLTMPDYSRVDRMGVNNDGCVATVEFKSRASDREHDQPDVMLAADKWWTNKLVGEVLKTTPWFAVRFADGVMRYCDLSRVRPWRFGVSGRSDRNDPRDLEPCVWFRIDDMARLARR